MHVFAGEIVGVFAHVERANQDRAGGFHAFDQRRVTGGFWQVAIDFRSSAGGKPLHVEQVFHREWHAGELADSLARRSIDRLGLRARAIGGDVGEGIEDGIALGDARQRGLDDIQRGHLAARDGLRDF